MHASLKTDLLIRPSKNLRVSLFAYHNYSIITGKALTFSPIRINSEPVSILYLNSVSFTDTVEFVICIFSPLKIYSLIKSRVKESLWRSKQSLWISKQSLRRSKKSLHTPIQSLRRFQQLKPVI